MKIVFYKTLLTRGRNITPTERIVYSFLVSKSITYFSDLFDSDGSCIDTYKSVLAEQFATTKIAITKLLNRLYELGLVERLENGKLQIN